ncbi:MAG: alpha/beta hydrolase fold domain-containing protein [Clostridia bacterium]|nr:alpha/beta hydrolase fold domain-containing protein [Clostridia bacterium]
MKKKNSFLRSQLLLLKPFISGCSLQSARKWQDKIGELMTSVHKDYVDSEEIKVGEINCAMQIPRDEVSSGVILYLHGGGYVTGNLSYAKGFASVLASKCGIRVFTVEYRLAPEHTAPTALDDCLEAYGYLLSNGYDPSQIIICGESAGGGLCYALCHKLRDKGRTQPAGIITVSPWVDLTLSASSFITNEKNDPSMTRERLKYFADLYTYGAVREGKKLHPKTEPDEALDFSAKSDTKISPLLAEQDKMPPSLIFVGGDEILLDDSVSMHGKLLEAGSESHLVVKPDMWHGYVLYCLKEHEDDFDKIAKFIKNKIPMQKKLRWMGLDNAAKIFPAARRRNWSNVFRLSATMSETIDRELMQTALDVTVRRFPSIAVRIKAGAFWYYLEQIPKTPDILDEKPYPLARMPFDDIRKCAFRVLIYEKRVAVEFFHALTDGNGGLIFLKTLVSEYIYQRYGVKVPVGDGILDRLEEPSDEELEDSFLKYAGDYPASRADTDAFRIMGKREEDGFKTNTTFILDAANVSREAKSRGITVTAYLTAAFIVATARIQEQRVRSKAKYKPIKILIPVNLRKIFPSKTLRNFVMYASPGIDPRLGHFEFDEICDIVKNQMKLQITDKNMAAIIATNVNDEKNPLLKIVPLFLKNIVMKLIFNAVGEKKSCYSFSNLGVVDPPEEFKRYVDRLDFVIGNQASAPYNVAALAYKGKIYLNIIRNISDPILEAEFHKVFRELGIEHVVESNTRERKI